MNSNKGFIFIVPKQTGNGVSIYCDTAICKVANRFTNTTVEQIEVAGPNSFGLPVVQILQFDRFDTTDKLLNIKEGYQSVFPDAHIAVVAINRYGAPTDICFSDNYQIAYAVEMRGLISNWMLKRFNSFIEQFQKLNVTDLTFFQ